MYRRGQASAVGAVFLTLIVILLAALIARQIQVQTEVQNIASEVANQRSGEGELSLTLNYTYLTSSLGKINNSDPTCIQSLDGIMCNFDSRLSGGTYTLTLIFSATNPPSYFYNVTTNLYLLSSDIVQATLYENNSGTLIARGTYTLPANSPIVITSHYVNYTIVFSSTSPFRISIDFLNYTFQAYNSTGFYAKITNIGPSLTRLYGLWLLSSTYARRINTSTWLEPGVSQTFSVNLPVNSISEIRAITTTRVNIFRISVKPPTLTAAPGPGGGGANSKFVITSYNQTIAGPVSSKQLFVATVQNTGNASGTVRLEVWNDGNLVNSSQATIPAGGSATMSLYVTLPSTPGTYTWAVKAYNLNTGRYDDEKTFTVSVYGELIKNGDFSQGSAYWTLESPWRIDTSLQLARINLANPGNISASISQNFTVSSAVTLTQLKLYYYMYANPPGQVNSLQLVVSIESGSTTLWSQTINWNKNNNPAQGNYAAQPSIRLAPGTYTLRITALLNAQKNLNQVDIRVDNVSLLATP